MHGGEDAGTASPEQALGDATRQTAPAGSFAAPGLAADPSSHPDSAAEGAQRWRASLRCRFARRGERTTLARREHAGPLLVQRPFYPEGPGTCHLYLIHPPGGIAGGDALSLDVALEAGARALVTTPAATKVYRSLGPPSAQHQRFVVGQGAQLEWLPQETLVFDRANAQLATRVELEGDAAFVGWEVVGLGRPARGERFDMGRLRQRFEVYRDGVPLFLERTRLEGGDAVLEQPWGLAGQPVFGTMFMRCQEPQRLVERIRAEHACDADGLFVTSALSGGVVCRYLGPWAELARKHFAAVWQLCRPELLGRAAHPPRIWAT